MSTHQTPRVRRHLLLAGVSVAMTAAVYFGLEGRPVYRASMASAYVGLSLLGLSLVLGPWKILRGQSVPVSTNLRRDVGIWAGLLGVLHSGVGLFVHFKGRPWMYFAKPTQGADGWGLRVDPFGAANYSGLAALLVLTLLLAVSNNRSLRRLGAARWKCLQRWNYALFGLVLVHGVLYQVIEKRNALFVLVLSLTAVAVVTLQTAGFRRYQLRAVGTASCSES
jgi:sulfoxide reductase heme-binding subunit YedZ